MLTRKASEGAPAPHWGFGDVVRLADAARELGRGENGERDWLLVATLFDGALRVSEALGLRPLDILQGPEGCRLQVDGKGGLRQAAVSPSLAARLLAYAYARQWPRDSRFWPVTRARAWQIVGRAAERAGLVKPDGVGTVHILRHSGAIERLRVSGNPRSVQDQLGHASAAMTLRYFRTLAREEGLRIQQEVNHAW